MEEREREESEGDSEQNAGERKGQSGMLFENRLPECGEGCV